MCAHCLLNFQLIKFFGVKLDCKIKYLELIKIFGFLI